VTGDVFSLGVLLGELIANRPAGEKTATDLAAIQCRAVAHSPSNRYSTVAALAQDLTRWLRRLPVQAMLGNSWRYRARLFVARNLVAVLISQVTLLGLATATVVSTRLYLAGEKARVAEAQRAEEIRDLNSYLVKDLSEQMVNRPGMAEATWQTLVDTRKRLESLAASKPDDLRVQIDLSRNIARIAVDLFDALPQQIDLAAVRADVSKAETRLKKLEPAGKALASYWEVRAELSSVNSAAALHIDGSAGNTAKFAQDAMLAADRALALDGGSADAQASSVAAKTWIAAVQNSAGQFSDAIATLDAAQVAARLPDERVLLGQPRLLRVKLNVDYIRCDILRWSRPGEDALRQCRQAEQSLRRAIRAKGPLLSYEADLAYTLFLIATMLPAPAESATALAHLNEARDLDQRILHFGTHQRIAGEALVIEAARANALALLGRFDEARASARYLLEQRRQRYAQEPGIHGRRREVATALRRVGEVELMAGNSKTACSAFAEAGAIWDGMERDGSLLGFDRAMPSGQVPWIRDQLSRCKP
jgi:tetratricopeptide (TPR) repeat protein